MEYARCCSLKPFCLEQHTCSLATVASEKGEIAAHNLGLSCMWAFLHLQEPLSILLLVHFLARTPVQTWGRSSTEGGSNVP